MTHSKFSWKFVNEEDETRAKRVHKKRDRTATTKEREELSGSKLFLLRSSLTQKLSYVQKRLSKQEERKNKNKKIRYFGIKFGVFMSNV
jgi:hypothetical protein